MLQLYVENATQWNLDGQEPDAVTMQIDAVRHGWPARSMPRLAAVVHGTALRQYLRR
jgi:hypothetical protein